MDTSRAASIIGSASHLATAGVGLVTLSVLPTPGALRFCWGNLSTGGAGRQLLVINLADQVSRCDTKIIV